MLKKIMTTLKTLNSLFLNLLVDGPDRHVYEYVYNLFILVILLKPRKILNLGTGGKGASLRALLAGLIYNGEGGHIITVEILNTPQMRAAHQVLQDEIEAVGGAGMVKFVTMDDLQFQPAGNVDLIFLDTDHTYYHTLAELNKFSQCTRLIVLHDTRIKADVPLAVQKAIDTFLKHHQDWRNSEVGATPFGLGILYKL